MRKKVTGASVFAPYNQQSEEVMRDYAITGLQIDTERFKTPMDFMKLFLTDELVQQHVDDTNLHADNIRATTGMKRRSRKKDWKPVTLAGMLQFLE